VRRSRALSIAAVAVSILAIVGIAAAALVPLLSGDGLPEVRLLDDLLPAGDGSGSVETAGELQPNGDVLVTHRVRFPDDGSHTVTLVRPCGDPPFVFACGAGFEVGGRPAATSERAARTEVAVEGRDVVVTYVLHGAVLAYADVAVVEWPLLPSPFGSSPFEDRVEVSGALGLPSAVAPSAAEAHLHAADKDRTETIEARRITFEAGAPTLFDVALHAAVPSDLVPGIPDIRRSAGDGLDTFRQTEAIRDRADDVQASSVGAVGSATETAAEVRRSLERAVAGLALAIPALLWLIVLVMLVFRLRRLAQPLPDTPRYEEEPPSEHDPAVVSVLVNGGKPGPEAVAGSILALAGRGEIEFQDLPAEAFRLTVRDTAMGTGYEGLLLETLRTLQVEERGHIDAPPLWKRKVGLWSSFRKDAIRRAEVAGLVEAFVSTRVAIAAIIVTVLGLGALYSPVGPGVFFTIAIPLLILAIVGTLRFGYDLSYPGLILQARWQAYGRHLRERTSIAEAPPAGVVVWGPALVYGTVLGVAPESARLLSPPE
jgi:predicted membrane protein DUF2207